MISKRFYINIPIAILLFEWFAVFYLNFNNPYHFRVMSSNTFAIILTGLLFIILGYYTVNSFYLRTNDIFSLKREEILINERLFGISIIILSIVALFGLLLVFAEISKITNGFKLYLENPFMVRQKVVMLSEGKIAGISAIRLKIGSYLCSIIYPLTILGGIAMAQRSKWRLTGILPFIVIILYSIVYLNRFGLIMSMGLWFISLVYFGAYLPEEDRRSQLKKTALYLILGLVFIIFFFSFIIRWRSFAVANIEYYAGRSIYAYFAGPVSAFDKFLFYDFPFQHGISSFRSVVKWLAQANLVNKEMIVGSYNTFFNIGQGEAMSLNTFSFAKSPYEDFGIVGLAVICMVWGGFARYSIERFLRRFSVLSLFLVALLILSLIMSFYEFSFQALSIYLYWGLIIVLFEYLLKKFRVIRYVEK